MSTQLKYRRLAKALEESIKESATGDKLPSISQLRQQHKVSRSTVDGALGLLERKGVIVRRPKRGIFVSSSRPLRSGSSRFVDLILPGEEDVLFAKTIRAVHSALEAHGYRMNLSISGLKAENELRMLKRCTLDPSAGVIFMPYSEDEHTVMALEELAEVKPVVQIDRRYSQPKTDYVAVDGHACAMRAMEYLLSLGHVRIGAIRHKLIRNSSLRDRYRAYLDALERAGIVSEPAWEVCVSDDGAVSDTEVRRVMDREDAPTAFFALNNSQAVAFIRATRATGLIVPRDAAVVGVDDPDVARDVVPALTYVAQRTETVAATSVEVLVKRIEGGDAGPVEEVLLDGPLVQGHSCGEATVPSSPAITRGTQPGTAQTTG